MIGNAPPWFDSVEIVTEITNGGDLINPAVVGGEVPVTVPQFGNSGAGVGVPTGWAAFGPADPALLRQHVAVDRRNDIEARILVGGDDGELAPGQYGLISSFFAVTVGHSYRARVSVYDQFAYPSAAPAAFLRVEAYNASTTVVMYSWQQLLIPPWRVWTDMEVITGAIPAGVARIRIIVGHVAVGWDHDTSPYSEGKRWRDPALWDNPLNPAVQSPEPLTWRDVSCDVAATTIRYGREKQTDRFDVATAAITLRNVDGAYTYRDPHPDNFRPGRLIRTTAIHDGVTYPMFYGVIDSIADAFDIDGKSTVIVTAYDPTTLLASVNWRLTYGVSAGLGELTGARINRLLDYVAYPIRAIDTGTIAVQAMPTVSTRPLRDDAGITADTEGGAVYVERNGSVVFRDATWRASEVYASTITANLVAIPAGLPIPYGVDGIAGDDPTAPHIHPSDLVTDWSLRRVINRVALANAGGTAQTFDDVPSQRRHGVRNYQRLDFIGTSDAYLPARGAALLAAYATSRLRVDGVTFHPAEAMTTEAWQWTLRVFFNFLVRVWYAHPVELWGFGVMAYVQGVEHRITPTDWATTLRLDDPVRFASFDLTAWSVWASETDAEALWDEAVWDGAFWDFVGHHEPAFWDTAVWL